MEHELRTAQIIANKRKKTGQYIKIKQQADGYENQNDNQTQDYLHPSSKAATGGINSHPDDKKQRWID